MARTLSRVDRELFRRAMADVRPLPESKTQSASERPPGSRRSSPRVPIARRGQLPGKDGHDLTRVSAADLAALRRGRLRVDATLDLHGLTSEAARRRLHEFIDDATGEGLRCVRIVHGKGLRSGPGGPVLKTLVERELNANLGVAAFAPACPADGGSGATVALLPDARGRRRPARR